MGVRRAVLAVVTSSVLVVAGAIPGIALTDEEATAGEIDEVLFIGDRLIAWNDRLDSHFMSLATSDEAVSEFLSGSFTLGDASLKDHYEMSVTAEGMEDYGALDMIREGDYDVVVLQGALSEPSEERFDEYLEYAILFDEEIRARGGRTVLLMTWPSPLADEARRAQLADFYRQAGADLGVAVAPVGLALANAQAAHPEIRMVGLDERLPAIAGTYLGAAVIYASLFERSPEGLPYWPLGVFEDDAGILQEIAWHTVEEWRSGG